MEDKGCFCLPIWLNNIKEKCFQCKEDDPNDNVYWLYPCIMSETKVHFVCISLHSNCKDAYLKYILDRDYRRFVQKIDYPETDEERLELIKNCRNHHKPTSSSCGNCQVTCQDGLKFYRCTRCKTNTYCSQLCQKEHWEIHKKVCFVEN